MNADDTINAVLDLHRPVEQDGDRLCAECDDFEPDSLSSPGYWPCETVKVIARSMGEQQAETRDARRTRAMNRPRGQAGTDGDAE